MNVAQLIFVFILSILLLTMTNLLACSDDDDDFGGDDDITDDDDNDSTDDDDSHSIEAPLETWTWIPFPKARCANDTPTGIGINPTDRSDTLFIFFLGGGLCWDNLTCNVLKTARNVHEGFGSEDLVENLATYGKTQLMDRDDPENPLRDFSYVFIPYCTGDLHSGAHFDPASGMHHVGYLNVGEYLKRIVPTFPNTSLIVLAGRSAGAAGVGWNFDRIRNAFGDVPIALLGDSYPPLSEEYLTPLLQDKWASAWGLAETIPPECDSCASARQLDIFLYGIQSHPQCRFGLISSLKDYAIRFFYGFGYEHRLFVPEADYTAALTELADEKLAPHENAHVYYVPGMHHVFIDDDLGSISVSGVTLGDWISDLVYDSSDWADVQPGARQN